jgi:hypothetical protein
MSTTAGFCEMTGGCTGGGTTTLTAIALETLAAAALAGRAETFAPETFLITFVKIVL